MKIKFKSFFAQKKIAGDCLGVLTGILLTAAFAPAGLYWLAILLPAVLFCLWQDCTPEGAFRRGFLFGLGFFGAGVYWVFISIHTFGNTSTFLAGFFTLAFIMILAIFPGLTGYFLNRYFPRPGRARLFYAFPALWVFLEWVRSWICTGFPWLLLGYSQIHSPLRGYAAITGVYGLSLLTLITSGLLLQFFLLTKQGKYKHSLYCFLIALVIWSVGALLDTIAWTHPFGKPVTVSLVQGNIPEETKWSFDRTQNILDTYTRLTTPHWNSNIIIWPESAITIPLASAADFLDKMDAIAKKHQTTFITGIPVELQDREQYYNAVVTLGHGKGYYLKHRLVPFGEYTPFHEWLGKLLNFLNIPMSDFVAATDNAPPLIAGNLNIAAFICYEIAFPEMVLSRDGGINLLLTVSNDAWFGHSIAQAQHLEMARMRAAENQRPVLFVSNNGITAVINAKGDIQSSAPPYIPTVLTDTVQPVSGRTPWQFLGMDPILTLTILLIVLALRDQRRQRKQDKQ